MGGEIELEGPDLSSEASPPTRSRDEIPAIGRVDAKPVIVIRTIAGLRAVGGRAPTTERTPVTTCSTVG